MKIGWIFKVLLIGSNGSGKSAFINYDKDNPKLFNNFRENIGLDFYIKRLKIEDDLFCHLQIWDINAAEHFYFIIPSYFRGTAIFILFFDLTDPHSFMNLPIWIDILHAFSEEIPIMLIGTKSNLTPTVAYEDIINFAHAHELIGPYFISIQQRFNIDTFFKHIAEILTGVDILSNTEKNYLRRNFNNIEQFSQIETSNQRYLNPDENDFINNSNLNDLTQSNESRNNLLRLRDIMRGEMEFQASKKIKLSLEERKELTEFLNYFKFCPICNSKNHLSYLKRFYFSKDKNKMKIKQQLLELMKESVDFKKRYYNHITLGIPCCECFQKYCKMQKNFI
jgi:GTPase SAR1 family protein